MFLELRNLWTRIPPSSAGALAVCLFGVAIGGCSADITRLNGSHLGGESSRMDAAYKADFGFAPSDASLSESEGANYSDETRTVAFTETGSIGSSELPPARPSHAPGVLPDRVAPIAASDDSRAAPVRVADALPPGPAAYESGGNFSADEGFVTVVPGDTLYSISRRNGVTVSDLKYANGLATDVIVPGQRLVLPGADDRIRTAARDNWSEPPPRRDSDRVPAIEGRSYTVREGDSLYAIARANNVSVAELKSWNDIRDARTLRPGQVLSLGPTGRETEPRGFAQDPRERDLEPEPRRFAHRTARTETIREPREFAAPPLSESRSPDLPPILNGDSRPRDGAAEASNREQLSEEPVVANLPASEGGRAGEPSFRWPVRGRVIAEFGPRPDGSHNDGIDIAVPIGTEIVAANDGVVAYAGNELKGYGNLVLIRHDNGWVSAYAHADQLLVKRGDSVRRGQVIARAGNTGAVERPMVHFELREGAKPVDPRKLLGS